MSKKKIIREAFFAAIEEQRTKNNPPEVRETFNRLLKAGYSELDARKLIAQCFSVEIFDIMKHGRPFDDNRYVRNLNNLPEAPEDKREDIN